MYRQNKEFEQTILKNLKEQLEKAHLLISKKNPKFKLIINRLTSVVLCLVEN